MVFWYRIFDIWSVIPFVLLVLLEALVKFRMYQNVIQTGQISKFLLCDLGWLSLGITYSENPGIIPIIYYWLFISTK